MLSKKTKHKLNAAVCIGDMYSARPFVKGLCDTLTDNGVNLHIFNGDLHVFYTALQEKQDSSIFSLPNFDMLDILIVAPFFLSPDDKVVDWVIKRAVDAGKPVLCVGIQHEGCYCLLPDYVSQIKEITEHIIKVHNISDIAYISGIKGNTTAEERLSGFKKALEENNIPFDESKVYYGDFWDIPTIRCVDEMIKKNRLPKAIVCANDTMGITAAMHLTELGYRIPDDVCVTGMDGLDESEGYLTTANILTAPAGNHAAELAIKILRSENVSELSYIKSDIVYTASCGCRPLELSSALSIRHKAFRTLYDTRVYQANTLRATQELSNCTTFAQFKERLDALMEKFWAKNCWLCVEKGIIDNFSKTEATCAEDFSSPEFCFSHDRGYGDKMSCISMYIDGSKTAGCNFTTADMLPDFYEVSDSCRIILYTSVDIKGDTIGYFAFDYYPWSNCIQILSLLTAGISTAFESIWRQNVIYSYAKKMDYLYITDPLTKVYNRRGFFRSYAEYIKDKPISDSMVISIDLDNLKQINDNFGHKEGDFAIEAIADALRHAARNGEICARFGGDEFVVFGACEDKEYMNNFLRRFKRYLTEFNRKVQKPYNIHASCGGIIMPAGTDKNIDFYINSSDSKMYVSKQKYKKARS